MRLPNTETTSKQKEHPSEAPTEAHKMGCVASCMCGSEVEEIRKMLAKCHVALQQLKEGLLAVTQQITALLATFDATWDESKAALTALKGEAHSKLHEVDALLAGVQAKINEVEQKVGRAGEMMAKARALKAQAEQLAAQAQATAQHAQEEARRVEADARKKADEAKHAAEQKEQEARTAAEAASKAAHNVASHVPRFGGGGGGLF